MNTSMQCKNVYEFTEVNTGLCSSIGLLWIVVIILLIGFRLVAVGIVVKQGDWCDFTPTNQPSRSDWCAELQNTSDTE